MKHTFIYPLIILLIAACAKPASEALTDSPSPIVFTMSENAFDTATKSVDETSMNTLTSVHISARPGSGGAAAWNDVVFYKKTGNSYTGSMYWPATDEHYYFYAANQQIYDSGGRFILKPTSTSSDIVCGYNTSAQYKQVNTINLSHIFTRIGKVTCTAKDGYSIDGLTLSIIPLVPGDDTVYDITDRTWSNAHPGEAVKLGVKTGSENRDFLLIPGNYKLKASWTASKAGYNQTFTNIESEEIELLAGYKYSITCSFGGSASDLTFSFSIADWKTESLSIEF